MRPSVFVRTQYWYAEGVPAATNFHRGSCRQYGNAKLKNNRIWTCRFPSFPPVPPTCLPCATMESIWNHDEIFADGANNLWAQSYFSHFVSVKRDNKNDGSLNICFWSVSSYFSCFRKGNATSNNVPEISRICGFVRAHSRWIIPALQRSMSTPSWISDALCAAMYFPYT